MPNTNVIITIRSCQCFEGVEEEWVEQEAEGCLEQKGEGWTLTYLESEEAGLGSTRTTLELTGGRITLTRAGETSSQMVFEEGTEHTSDYQTPYGSLPLTIQTSRLLWQLEEGGGRVAMDYAIRIGPQQSGMTRFRMKITRKREEENHD